MWWLQISALFSHWKSKRFRGESFPKSKFFFYSLIALSSQASSQALHFWNKLNRLRIPTGRRQTSWLYTSTAEEFSQGLPGTNPASGQSGTWTQDLQISSPAPSPLGHAISPTMLLLNLMVFIAIHRSYCKYVSSKWKVWFDRKKLWCYVVGEMIEG